MFIELYGNQFLGELLNLERQHVNYYTVVGEMMALL